MAEVGTDEGSLQTLGGGTGSASMIAICIMLNVLKYWGGFSPSAI